jgi:2,5-diketo-D-gluconate reductase B
MKNITVHQESVPALGFGTWMLNGSSCTDAVTHAIAMGYRHIDTAHMYGNEEYVGKGIKGSGLPRHEIFLTTKVWFTNLKYERVFQSAHESLKKLGTDYVNLLLIHWPNKQIPLEETISAMLELQNAGKTRHIGVSNFPPSLLNEAMQYANIFCNQVEYHPFLSQQKLLKICEANDIVLTAYSPIAQGEVNHQPVLIEIGNKYNKTPVQVTLRWLLQQKNVAAIPKAASSQHRRSNLDIFNFELTRDEMKAIFNLAKNRRLVDAAWAPDWEN